MKCAMELQQRIEQALKEAIREKNENGRNAIRLLHPYCTGLEGEGALPGHGGFYDVSDQDDSTCHPGQE